MPEYKTLKIDKVGKVMNVILHNPPINLQDDDMMADLNHLVSFLESDRETKVVVFRSDVPDYFMAHFDIRPGENRQMPPLGAPSMHGILHTRISHLDQVTIGELRGRARGGGSEILLSFDMRYASIEKGIIGQPEIMLGLHAGAGGTVRLAQLMGRSRAFEAALSGMDYDALTAEKFGWVTRALPDAEITSFVDTLAQRIASFPRSGIESVKSIINQMSSTPSAVLAEDSVRFWKEITLPETQERLSWWLEHGAQEKGPMEDNLGVELAKYPKAAD
jgi:enoyl-CoA hydratase/carnithine racemase